MTREVGPSADSPLAGRAGGGPWAEPEGTERARDAALAACAAARAEVVALEEEVAFLREVLRGATEHAAAALDAADTELADLRVECAALLAEVGLLDAELGAQVHRGPAWTGGAGRGGAELGADE